MPPKPTFSDYEPLKRLDSKKPVESDSWIASSRTREAKANSESDDGLSLGSPKLGRGFDFPTSEVDQPKPTTVDPVITPDKASTIEMNSSAVRRSKKALPPENWILRHGHAVSFAGVFLFTALVFFRPYELSPSLMWLSSSAFWVAIATLIIFVPTQLGLEGNLTMRPREVNLALLLLVAGILSITLALDRSRALNGLIDFAKVISIFIVMVNVIRTKARLKKLWIVVIVASCVLSLAAMNDYRTGKLALQGVRIQGAIGGLFDNPNDLALHLVTMIPIAVAVMMETRNPLSKILWLVCAFLLLGGVVATFSRGGFLALVCSGGVFLWKCSKRSRLPVIAAGAVLFLAFLVVAPGGYGTRLSTTSDDSAKARFDDLKRSIFIAVRHPITGVGIDNYILYSNSNKASHNAYTQVASEMGIAAAVFYILFIVAPLKRLRRLERETSGVREQRSFYYLAIGLQASLVGYMVASFFASVAYLWYVYYLVAYCIALRRLYDVTMVKAAAPDTTSSPSTLPLTAMR